jgi:hypothetical protein
MMLLVIELPFSVPSDGANSTIHVRTDVTFRELMAKLADELSVAPKEVKVAYRFTVEPRSAPWSHLQSDTHLAELIKKARLAIEKQRKSKSTRAFAVELKDLAGANSDRKAASKSKGKESEKDKERKRKKKKVSVVHRSVAWK